VCPLRRFARCAGRAPSRHRNGSDSRGVTRLFRVLKPAALASALASDAPLLPSTVTGWTSGVSRPQAPGQAETGPRHPLVSFRSPSEYYQATKRPCPILTHTTDTEASIRASQPATRLPPLRSWPLQRFPSWSSGSVCEDCHILVRAASSGFLNLLTLLIRPMTAGLVSCQFRSWGSLSRASPFHAGGNCLQCQSPRAVGNARQTMPQQPPRKVQAPYETATA
jgi:hypothetical protein